MSKRKQMQIELIVIGQINGEFTASYISPSSGRDALLTDETLDDLAAMVSVLSDKIIVNSNIEPAQYADFLETLGQYTE
ncbi:MAG: hypothetical protein ABIH82_00555 [Candidatus Woesearchaeota archaeon]